MDEHTGRIPLDVLTLLWVTASGVLLALGFGYGAPWFGILLLAVGLAGAVVSAKWRRVRASQVTGAFITLGIIFTGFIWLAQSTGHARELHECQHRQALAAEAVLRYAEAHGTRLPAAPEAFRALITSPAADPFTCPARQTWRPMLTASFGYNNLLAGTDLSQVKDPAHLILFIDGGGAAHQIAGLDDVAPTRHGGTLAIATFCDGTSGTVYLEGRMLYKKPGEPVRLTP